MAFITLAFAVKDPFPWILVGFDGKLPVIHCHALLMVFKRKCKNSPVTGPSKGDRVLPWVDFFISFFLPIFLNDGACVLPLNEINVVHTALLEGFKNRTSWITISKRSLHLCNGLCLLSDGIMPPIWCKLPHTDQMEMAILMVSKKKVMSGWFFPACTKKSNLSITAHSMFLMQTLAFKEQIFEKGQCENIFACS